MKLVTFQDNAGASRLGALIDGGIADLALSHRRAHGGEDPALASMLALIESGPAGLDLARSAAGAAASRDAVLADGAATLEAPLIPQQMRDCLVFEQHLRQATEQYFRKIARNAPDPDEAMRQYEASGAMALPEVWYQQPIYYKCNRFSVIGPGQDVVWPRYASVLDYELEYGVVIGKRGADIAPERWQEHVFGYTIFNDISARDAQFREMPGRLGPAKGKDFDTGNVLGPAIVTADEIPDPYDLTMIARINGEEWSRGNSGTMHHRWDAILAHISNQETLHPGEFIGSGTVGGGCGAELDRWLQPGDEIELEVTGFGILRNTVVKK